MTVVLDRRAAKYLKHMSEPAKSRIKDAIAGLSNTPPAGDIKKLADRDDYRLRIGGYRIIYRVENDTIIVSTIAPRGQAYKE
jgi:mRNA interferase RelE/StbE